MQKAAILFLGSLTLAQGAASCTWNSKAGGHYDLRPLIKPPGSTDAYKITDGDIPCTPETEPSFHYAWNFCANVPSAALPEECKAVGMNAAVLQYANYGDGNKACHIVGHYDSKSNELTYNVLDVKDPSKGVSVTYPTGENCDTNTPRSATIDVLCANTPSVIVSAQEPEKCQYHMVMKSYHGCPTECPITSNGLCNSHGHCAYDSKAKQSYCFCNDGWYGSACDSTNSGESSYDGFSVQLGLLITLLVVALALTGGMIYLSLKIGEFRKQQIESHYKSLPGGENEMVETVSFR
eukprot:gene14062-10045_t